MKEKKIINRISKSQLIIMLVFGVITIALSLGTSYAANVYLYDSKDVKYDNTESGIVATDVQGAVDELYRAATDYSGINTRVTTLETQIYPVGSIYISINNTNPSTIFGGTWESFGEGRTLIGVGTGTDSNSIQKVFVSNETGGEYNHTLTVNEMPSHNHVQTSQVSNGGITPVVNRNVSGGSNGDDSKAQSTWLTGKAPITTFNTGGSQSHNNIQPYITVFMWKRTA